MGARLEVSVVEMFIYDGQLTPEKASCLSELRALGGGNQRLTGAVEDDAEGSGARSSYV
jgi:hypothetical protein